MQEHLEMTMLDKEVAEERAELAETELEEIKEKLAVLEVENGVLKTGGGTGESSNAAAKSSMAYIQLGKTRRTFERGPNQASRLVTRNRAGAKKADF